MTQDDTSNGDLEQCETGADVRANDGQRAAVAGTYEQVDVRQRTRGDPVYRGHAAVRLDDGTRVHLEPTWAQDAQRDDDEIERFEGRRVRAVGTVHEEPPDPPRPVAYVVAPCLCPVEQVEAVD